MADYPVEPRPEPVMNAAYMAGSFIGLVKLILAGLVAFGVWDINDEQQTILVMIVTAAVDFGIVAFTMWQQARPQVTPLESPMDATMTPLVRASDGQSAVTEREAKAARR